MILACAEGKGDKEIGEQLRCCKLTERQIRRASHNSVRALIDSIEEFIGLNNQNLRPLKWVKSADEILKSIARLAHSTIQINSSNIQ